MRFALVMLAALLYYRADDHYPRRQNNTMAKDFDYYKNLNDVIVHSLLHVLMQANQSPRYIPTQKRNELNDLRPSRRLIWLRPLRAQVSAQGAKHQIPIDLVHHRYVLGFLYIQEPQPHQDQPLRQSNPLPKSVHH